MAGERIRIIVVDQNANRVVGLSVRLDDGASLYPKKLGIKELDGNGEAVFDLPSNVDAEDVVLMLILDVNPVLAFRLEDALPEESATEYTITVPVSTDILLLRPSKGWELDGIDPATENKAQFFIDNDKAWKEITEWLRDELPSTVPVRLMQLFWEEGFRTLFNKPIPDPSDPGPHPVDAVEIEDVLKKLGSRLKILMHHNDFPSRAEDLVCIAKNIPWSISTPFNAFDNFKNVKKRFKSTGTEVRGFKLYILEGVLHSKMIVAGDVGYLLASPFMQSYFDGPDPDTAIPHRIDDGRRGAISPFYGFKIAVPIHDVSVGVQGPAADKLRSHFFDCWNNATVMIRPRQDTPETAIALDPRPAWKTAWVQIARTLPGDGRFPKNPELPHGQIDIFRAYHNALDKAQKYVYLETQYFTDAWLAGLIVNELFKKPDLKVIMLLNAWVDFPLYVYVQHALITSMLQALKLAPNNGHKRIGFFTRWRSQHAGGKHRIINNYVHAKTAIADDVWATIGTANLDPRGLTFVPLYALACQEIERRSVEVNALLLGDASHPSDLPLSFRQSLWVEHLGFDSGADSVTIADPLALWNKRAQEKIDALKVPREHSACVLPYVAQLLPNPRRYLQALLGAIPNDLDVLEAACSFEIDNATKTGKWNEKPCRPMKKDSVEKELDQVPGGASAT